MFVLKFGGTSIGTAERIKSVAQLVSDSSAKIVVLSAMSGTTDKLEEINDYLYKQNFDTAHELVYQLESQYHRVIEDLFGHTETKDVAYSIINAVFDTIKSYIGSKFGEKGERSILAQGEIMSTGLFDLYLKELNVNSHLLPALEFMKTNENGEPDYSHIQKHLNQLLQKHSDIQLFVTQGYICRNAEGDIDNLKRGGSDYTASIIGGAVEAEEIQIWTDIDGIHNNDPRYVENTHPIPRISFDEAAELAYFGAKVLHPSSILPAKFADIPVRLKNTLNPSGEGTVITKETKGKGVRAIAAKDDITKIRIQSSRMLQAYGFLRKVFEIFEQYETPIDMITTSEVGVSLTIDSNTYLANIVEHLKKYGTVSVDEDQVIICVVGYLIGEHRDAMLKIIQALHTIPIQMISYGGSFHNISFLIPAQYKQEALNQLNDQLF